MSQDLRVQKTRASIEDCLIRLLENYPFREITIRKITEECRINRSTFYRNYEDKYALLTQVSSRLLEEYRVAIRPEFILHPNLDPKGLRPYFSPLVAFCNRNQKILVVMWSRELPVSLFEEMLPVCSGQLLETMRKYYHLEGKDLSTASYFSRVIASDILIAVRWWYEESPIKEEDELLRLISAVTKGIFQNMERQFSKG